MVELIPISLVTFLNKILVERAKINVRNRNTVNKIQSLVRLEAHLLQVELELEALL